MIKIWPYIVVFLLGFCAGMISFYYIVRDTIQNRKIVIRKNKQKNGQGNVQDLDLRMGKEMTDETKDNKALRQEKRAERKLKRSINNLKTTS